MAHDDDSNNPSGNRPFAEVWQASLSRREVLRGGLAGVVTWFCGGGAVSTAGAQSRAPLIGFRPVPVAEGRGPLPVISADYRFAVLIPWGEPLQPDGPAFVYPPAAADQARQIGLGHDGLWFFPILDPARPRGGWDDWDWDDALDWHGNLARAGRGTDHGMLCVNHEFARNGHLLGRRSPRNLAQVRVSQHAHGVSVVELQRNAAGDWRTVASARARRIHANTPVAFGGPAAGSPLLATPAGNPPRGTLNNCANGWTPWGTYLTCEENVNGYFGATNRNGHWDPAAAANTAQRRYGFSRRGAGYGWERFDPRFDLSDPRYRNEENRFGWVVEIDPMARAQVPVKRTALGRFKHEGVAVTVGRDGRLVCYCGDDQAFDYIYRFVSAGDWRALRRRGLSPLDHGCLQVAHFDDDHAGEWRELSIDNPLLAGLFASQAEILTHARLAADALGATPMDRPEWITVAPDGQVYCALTGNRRRARADAANPAVPNAHGHIIRWRDTDGHTGARFAWDIYLAAETTHGTENSFSNPDGLWADPDGRLFICTDGVQQQGLNNQLLVADTARGTLRRLLSGVRDSEITGIATTPDRRTLFVNIQHPGNGDPARTSFPAPPDGVTVPRDATLVIVRRDGGIVGA